MNSAKFYPFDLSEINAEYDNLIHEICSTYRVNYRFSERVYREVIQAHVLALLNERTYSLFNTIADDWKSRIIEMLFPNQFTDTTHYDHNLGRHLGEDELIDRIAGFNKTFERLNKSLLQILRPALDQNDPMFTIWAVDYNEPILCVEAVGDYRIEQWHTDYSVSRSSTRDTYTIELDSLNFYIQRLINFRGLPATINGLRKTDLLSEIIRNCVSYFLSKKTADLHDALRTLSLVSRNEDDHLKTIENYFNLEFGIGIEHISNKSTISQFTIYGNSVVIHFDSKLKQSRTALKRSEIERQLAESNMDYIPAKYRGT